MFTSICDLRSNFGLARNQGSRPTCCAFACSDLNAACRTPWTPLSCEYAFYHGAQRQGTGPGAGVRLTHMLDTIHIEGQPIELAWPYALNTPAKLSDWAPPSEVGELFHGRGMKSGVEVSIIRASLDQQRPILVVMSISNAFYFASQSGGVIDSIEPVDPTRIHALIAVGHGVRGTERFILIRNSWGRGWCMSGYAWVSDRYLAPRLIETATMNLVK